MAIDISISKNWSKNVLYERFLSLKQEATVEKKRKHTKVSVERPSFCRESKRICKWGYFQRRWRAIRETPPSISQLNIHAGIDFKPLRKNRYLMLYTSLSAQSLELRYIETRYIDYSFSSYGKNLRLSKNEYLNIEG